MSPGEADLVQPVLWIAELGQAQLCSNVPKTTNLGGFKEVPLLYKALILVKACCLTATTHLPWI